MPLAGSLCLLAECLTLRWEADEPSGTSPGLHRRLEPVSQLGLDRREPPPETHTQNTKDAKKINAKATIKHKKHIEGIREGWHAIDVSHGITATVGGTKMLVLLQTR